MYRLKGKNGLFIQPSDKIWQKESYDLLGYGTDNNAKLQNIFILYHKLQMIISNLLQICFWGKIC